MTKKTTTSIKDKIIKVLIISIILFVGYMLIPALFFSKSCQPNCPPVPNPYSKPWILQIIERSTSSNQNDYSHSKSQNTDTNLISGAFDESKFKTNEEWKEILTDKQYHILREKGTEIPFTGDLNDEKRKGTYYSAGCNEPLFRSEQKYDSGTGWPSFTAPIAEDVVVLRQEEGFDTRIEVLDKCGGHLGHVFDDGPTTLPDGRQATGKRFCINSDALIFTPDE